MCAAALEMWEHEDVDGSGVLDEWPIAEGEEQVTMPRRRLLGGRDVLHAPLGEGGMAVVYQATDRNTGRNVAVKVLKPSAAIPDAFVRFEREVALTSKVCHQNCVGMLDAGTEPVPFVVLELLAGANLRRALERPVPPAQALELTLQLLAGLTAVHDAGIVHRDIKAENLILTRAEDGRDRLVLIDFGAAIPATTPGLRTVQSITEVGQVLGTPATLSPEQLQGEPASYRSDLYAVGILMFEMLAHRPAFSGASVLELLMAKLGSTPLLPETVPPAVGWMVRSLLAPEPERRPASCAEAVEIGMYVRDMVRESAAPNTWLDLLPVQPPKT